MVTAVASQNASKFIQR